MNAAIRNHEAAHCALAVAAAGWVPLEVRADQPADSDGMAGRCRANFRDRGPDVGWLVAVLGGPVSEGDVIAWPPSEDADTADERIAAVLVRHLGLAKHEFLDALATARDLLARDEVESMVRLVATALDRVPVLNERQLRELLAPYLPMFNVDIEGTPTP